MVYTFSLRISLPQLLQRTLFLDRIRCWQDLLVYEVVGLVFELFLALLLPCIVIIILKYYNINTTALLAPLKEANNLSNSKNSSSNYY